MWVYRGTGTILSRVNFEVEGARERVGQKFAGSAPTRLSCSPGRVLYLMETLALSSNSRQNYVIIFTVASCPLLPTLISI